MEAILTGDIVNSRKVESQLWIPSLKKELSKSGEESRDWALYRGDSIQIRTTPEKALRTALTLRATMKEFEDLDLRVAVGIGEVSYRGDKVIESNGEAFIRSGECFDSMQKDAQKIAIRTPWKDFDETLNLMLALSEYIFEQWNKQRSMIIRKRMEHPALTQTELAEKVQSTQSYVSKALRDAGYNELQMLLKYYEVKIQKYV